MENNENKKVNILGEETSQEESLGLFPDSNKSRAEKLKKPIIFTLMGVVSIGFIYMIFNPSSDKKKPQDIGLNDAVPQATDAGLQSDKQKAYEQETAEQKEQEKRNSLMSLSDYWNKDTAKVEEVLLPEDEYKDEYSDSNDRRASGNPSLSSYRNAQNTLSSFYQDENYETRELHRQIEELKEQLANKDVPPPATVQDQLTLMEKSYEMAARYLPSGVNNSPPTGKSDSVASTASRATQKEYFVAFTPAKKNTVSALYREPTDSAFLVTWNENRNRAFYTVGTPEQVAQPRNSIRAVVQQTQTLTDESSVRLRLLETAKTPHRSIPQGTVLTANAKFQNGRLQLKVTSVELAGNIIPVDITIYDLDGQQGLYVPYSPEMKALTEIASNMSQTSGTSVMMTRSAGQQMAGDLSRGLVQGISGYFAKKVRTPKVTVKAGHQVFLVSKN